MNCSIILNVDDDDKYSEFDLKLHHFWNSFINQKVETRYRNYVNKESMKIRLISVFLCCILHCVLYIPDIIYFAEEHRSYVLWRLVCSLMIIVSCVVYAVLIQYTSIEKSYSVVSSCILLVVVGTISIFTSVKFMGYIIMGNDISSKYDYTNVIIIMMLLTVSSVLLFHLPFQHTVGLVLWYLLIYIILFFVCLEDKEKEKYIYQFILLIFSIILITYSSYSIERSSHNMFKLSLELKLKSDEACRANSAKSDYVNQLFHDIRNPLSTVSLAASFITKQTTDNVCEDKTKSVIIIDPQSLVKHSISSYKSTDTTTSLEDVNIQQKQNIHKQQNEQQQILSDKSSRIRCSSYPSDKSISKRNESFSFNIDFDINNINNVDRLLSEIKSNSKKDESIENQHKNSVDNDYYANIIHTQTIYINNLVNSVLTIDKMECGKLEIINKPFEIRPLLWEVANTFKHNLISKRILYKSICNEDIPIVFIGDGLRIQEIIMNLVSNAYKFTNYGGSIIVSTIFEDKYLEVSVTDSGVGISEEVLPNIFEKHLQIDPIQLQSGGGNGLGLSFCYNMCKLLNGKLTVCSKPNIGSTFTIKIPVEVKKDALVRFNSNSKSFSHFDQKILLIDDDKIHLSLCKRILKYKFNIGIVATALNSNEALKLLNENNNIVYDIICIDLNLHNSEMNGIELTNYIRNINSVVKIVGITGCGEKEQHIEFLNAGADDVIMKPLDLVKCRIILN